MPGVYLLHPFKTVFAPVADDVKYPVFRGYVRIGFNQACKQVPVLTDVVLCKKMAR